MKSELRLGERAAAALQHVAIAAGRLASLQQLADLVVDRARLIAGGDAAVLRWYEAGSSGFRLMASTGTAPDLAEEIEAKAPTSISEAFRTGVPVIVNDYRSSEHATDYGRRHEIRAQVAVPLLVEGRPVGTLAVMSHKTHTYEQADAAFLSLMASIVAPALEAARLNLEVQQQRQIVTQVYDALSVNVIVYDATGRPIHYNTAAREAWADALEDPSGNRDHAYPIYHPDGSSVGPNERPFARAIAERRPIRAMVFGFDVAGERRWSYVDAVPVFNAAGQVDFVITSSIDITRLKAVEERQRLDAERLRKLIEIQTELGRIDLSEEEIFRVAAECAVELTGVAGAAVHLLDGEQVVVAAVTGFGLEMKGMRLTTEGNPIRRCVEKDGAEQSRDALFDPLCNQEVARLTGIRSLLMAPIRHEGRVIGGLQLQSPDPGGFPEGASATAELVAGFAGEAVTRTRASAAQRASDQLFSAAFQASGVGMALTQLDGSVVRANPALVEMLGYTECELVGMDARALISPDDRTRAQETLYGLYRRSEPAVVSTEIQVVRKDGRMIWMRLTASLVRVGGEPRHVLLHLVDVTEERKAETILKSEHERLSVIIDALREIASNEMDIDRLLHVLVDQAVKLTGARAALVLLPKDDQLVVRAASTLEIPLGKAMPIAGSVAGAAFTSKEVQVVSDARTDPRVNKANALQFDLRAAISTPLIDGEGVLGVLQLVSTGVDAFDETDVRTLQMIAGFAAAAFERAATTQRLRFSEQRTRAVIELSPYPIVLIDSQGMIVGFNPAAEQQFLRERASVIGEIGTILLAPRYHEAFGRWIHDGGKAGSAEYAGQSFETTGIRSDGTEFPIEVAITNLPEEMRLTAVFMRDLTTRERLKESRERLATVISAAPVILFACDANGVVTLAEGKGLSILGLDSGQAVGRSFAELTDSQPECMEARDRVLKGETVIGQVYLRRFDRYLDQVVSPIYGSSGVVIGASAVLTDVTDRVRADAARRESEAKSRLMAMMNHEVRTPLNSILGFAHLLKDSKFGELTPKQRRYVDHIQSSGDHLLALVNDSLDLAKLDAGRINVHLAEIPVQPVMEEAANQLRPLAEARGLTLNVVDADGLRAHADSRQLLQVLLNLLSNAIRHTPATGAVTVSASQRDHDVTVSVTDTGQGIAREELGRIFEEFYQAGNHAPGGAGLGLAISRKLTEVMGGKITVESELGRGSTFVVHLVAA